MIKGDMVGRDSCTDRKQSLSLSSYHNWVQPLGADQRDAPCFHLSAEGPRLLNLQPFLSPHSSVLLRFRVYLEFLKSPW